MCKLTDAYYRCFLKDKTATKKRQHAERQKHHNQKTTTKDTDTMVTFRFTSTTTGKHLLRLSASGFLRRLAPVVVLVHLLCGYTAARLSPEELAKISETGLTALTDEQAGEYPVRNYVVVETMRILVPALKNRLLFSRKLWMKSILIGCSATR